MPYVFRFEKIAKKRIQEDRLILDLRTVFYKEEKVIIEILLKIDKDLTSKRLKR